MGWTVLYIAFGVVALWLLGEVLLQYKARLRWRLLAFVGFLGVVAGVLIPSVPVIGVGAAAFAVGQTYVTLSFRSGFASGWAVAGRGSTGGGSSKRRKATPAAEPTLEVSDLQAGPLAEQPTPPMYHPEPLPDEDTGGYAAYKQPEPAQAPYGDEGAVYGGYQPYGGYQQQEGYDAGQYGYGAEGYADVYPDPYGNAQQPAQQAYEPYGQQSYAGYGQQQYGAGVDDHYAAEASYDPDDVWVPQQRDGNQPPYPYQPEQGTGYGEQYRY
ncbi:hypothetical protein LRS74_25445 [Streptomyces sp. LX-29]|uniref:hypothetical protein n=1 Tax=Streptomyces sp. LX-29 TaxID=2900152 RepID=UPI00240D1DAF|nr:hypothetical protein [Streptomyces sp. LX-29]WFB10013.1 hypothetical protein LRS74_25445 [Streptomyces sp. LX-29]